MLLTTAPPLTPPVTILNTVAATVPFTIQGAASQSADLQRWTDNTPTTLAKVTATGHLVSTVMVETPYLFLSASGTGTIIDFNSTGSVISRDSSTGVISFILQNFSGASFLVQASHAASVPLIAKGSGSQTGDLQRWTDSTPTTLARITNIGMLGLGTGAGAPTVNTQSPGEKIRLYDDGVLSDSHSIGIAAGQMWCNIPASSTYGFYFGAVAKVTISSTLLSTTGDFSCKTIIPGTLDTMSYAGTIALDVTLAEVHQTTTINATGNATINASAGGTAGQRMTVIIINDATSGKTITFGTNFRPNGTLVGTISKAACVSFISNGTSWFEVGRQTGL